MADSTNGRARYCYKCSSSVLTPTGTILINAEGEFLNPTDAAWIGDSMLSFDIRYLLLYTMDDMGQRNFKMQQLTSNRGLKYWIENLGEDDKWVLTHCPYRQWGSSDHSIGTFFEANYLILRRTYLFSCFPHNHPLVNRLLSEHPAGLIPKYPYCPHLK